GLAQLLYFAERWEDARQVVEELGARHPDTTATRLALAAIAARLGDTEEARVMGEVLAAETAVPRTPLFLMIHRSADFESLQDFMPFQQFMRPRG
ncbi:MAG: hypothetical protein ACYSTY_13370, partial [Planctomycetota bacterium]